MEGELIGGFHFLGRGRGGGVGGGDLWVRQVGGESGEE